MYDMVDVVVFATEAHEGQKRKYTGVPYITHPISVAFIVASVVNNKHMIAAALLHDVLEDTDTTISDLLHLCNQRVTDFVLDVTDVSNPSDGNRKVRKQIDLEHLAKVPPESKTIKLADILDNAPGIIQYDPGFAKVWMQEKKLLLRFLIEGNPILYTKVDRIISGYLKENQ